MKEGMTLYLEEREEKGDTSLMPEQEASVVYKDKDYWKQDSKDSFTGHSAVDVTTSLHLRTV